MPAAFKDGGRSVGLLTALGFAVPARLVPARPPGPAIFSRAAGPYIIGDPREKLCATQANSRSVGMAPT